MLGIRQGVTSNRNATVHLIAAAAISALLAACSTASNPKAGVSSKLDASGKPDASGEPLLADKGDLGDLPSTSIEKTAGSPRPGRYLIGKAYQVAGKWFEPKEDTAYDRTGTASWYGMQFHGRRTANGEVFDRTELTAAHPTLPLPSYVRVTNVHNQRSIVVRVNDRGPFASKRLIDVSERTAELLDFKRRGMAKVRVEYVARADMEGDDSAFLLASYRAPEGGSPQPVVTLAAFKVPPPGGGVSLPGHIAPPPRQRPRPELALATADKNGAPEISDAVLVLSTPASPEARITTAFETVSPVQ